MRTAIRIRAWSGVLAVVLSSAGCRTRGHAEQASAATGDAAPPEDALEPSFDPSLELVTNPAGVAPSSAAPSGPFFVADANARAVAIRRADAPNIRYGSLDRASCEAELTRRGTPFAVADALAGVLAPVRLRGPVHGVSIHSDRTAKDRETSRYDVFDCRLALALDDFAALVATHDVTDIVFFAAFRPKTEYGCTQKYWGLQHCAALAVDVREFRRKDGSTLNVDRDFHGRIGLGTCAVGIGPSPQTKAADELWSFVCEAANRALFNVMLTPNYNAQHKNHFHLEITPQANWMMIK